MALVPLWEGLAVGPGQVRLLCSDPLTLKMERKELGSQGCCELSQIMGVRSLAWSDAV